MKPLNQGPAPNEVLYQIRVQGRLNEDWSDWFNGTTIVCENEHGDPPITTLTVAAADQAKLRGILSKIWDLNLAVISVAQIEPEKNKQDSQSYVHRGGL